MIHAGSLMAGAGCARSLVLRIHSFGKCPTGSPALANAIINSGSAIGMESG